MKHAVGSPCLAVGTRQLIANKYLSTDLGMSAGVLTRNDEKGVAPTLQVFSEQPLASKTV